MTDDLQLRRKWTVRAQGQQAVLVKRPNEKASHVWMKAFVWALYLPQFPTAKIELEVDDRFRPDVVALDDMGGVTFWGECGQLNLEKLEKLARKYDTAHLVVAKWGKLQPWQIKQIQDAVATRPRRGLCDILMFPPDSAERFVSAKGELAITHEHLDWLRVGGDSDVR